MKKGQEKKKAWQWNRTPDLVSSEQGCGLVKQSSVSHPRGRVFDPAVMLFFCPFFNSFCLLSFIYVVFFYLQHLPHYLFMRNYFPLHDTQRMFFFLIFQYLTNYLSLKLWTNENTETRGALLWTERASTFCLCSHRDPFAFFIALARLSDHKINYISSTTWTKQNKKHFFLRKLSMLDSICVYIYVLSTVSDDC